jgi:pyridoxal phosphate-dependent aminotransferase EpsN
MLISNDAESIAKARHWATQARDPALHYQHSEVGYNYRLSNILAGVGRGQLRVLGERVAARRMVFERYFDRLSKYDGIDFMPEAPYGKSTRWLTALTVDPIKSGVTSLQITEYLAERNIESRPVWKPLHLQPLFDGVPYYSHSEEESISDKLFECGLCLPSGSNMSEEEQNFVIDSIEELLQSK